ncbi:MAG: hypothetical protein V3U14_12975 [candidate division NC10 bacterium]
MPKDPQPKTWSVTEISLDRLRRREKQAYEDRARRDTLSGDLRRIGVEDRLSQIERLQADVEFLMQRADAEEEQADEESEG